MASSLLAGMAVSALDKEDVLVGLAPGHLIPFPQPALSSTAKATSSHMFVHLLALSIGLKEICAGENGMPRFRRLP